MQLDSLFCPHTVYHVDLMSHYIDSQQCQHRLKQFLCLKADYSWIFDEVHQAGWYIAPSSWLPAPVSTCCNLTVVGWRLLAHLHGAIRWETNELSQDTGDNTRVLDSDTLPPHVNQPATVSFPHSMSGIVWFTSVLLRRKDKEHLTKIYYPIVLFFFSFAVYNMASPPTQTRL